TARFWPTWPSTTRLASQPWLPRPRTLWPPKRPALSVVTLQTGPLSGSVCIWTSDTMTPPVDGLILQAQELFAQANDAAALENAKARFMGKQGELTTMLKGLAKLDPQQKKAEGARINQIKQEIEGLLNARRAQLAQAELERRLASETI